MFIPYQNSKIPSSFTLGGYCSTHVSGYAVANAELLVTARTVAGTSIAANKLLTSRSSAYWPMLPGAAMHEKLLGLSRWWSNNGLTGSTFNFLLLSGFYQFRAVRRVSSACLPPA
jgi:hypothetical protein